MRECCNEIQSFLERMEYNGINFDSPVLMRNDSQNNATKLSEHEMKISGFDNEKVRNTIPYGVIASDVMDSTIKNKLILHLISGLIHELEPLRRDPEKLLLLANDNKFVTILDNVQKKYDNAYKTLLDLRIKS
jgi:hypothetical protein